MLSMIERYLTLKEKIKEATRLSGRPLNAVQLIAVSKNHPLEKIVALYDAGCTYFGESRLQEALPKIEAKIDGDHHKINWHLIGSLQSNKVAKAIASFDLIHSVDSLKLAQKIGQTALSANKKMPILLQVNVTQEPSKHGFTSESLCPLFDELLQIEGIAICGLMTIGPLPNQVDWLSASRQAFSSLRTLKEKLERQGGIALPHLSMGMSQDYQVAIEEGSTLLRVGSHLFGPRTI